MEFTKAQIAALVLGYLKTEKCFAAVNEFVDASPYLCEYKSNRKYFITRVLGMSLVDFLDEYARIYCIVNGRLEASNYFNEIRKRTTLVDQILYLLDKEENTIVNSTPLSEARESDATPAYTLPGNICSDESDASSPKTPKRKTTRSRSNTSKKGDPEEIFDVSEVLTQTFLENHELQRKIAETINIVRNTPEVSRSVVTDEHISAGASKELDAIIKTVVQRTEEDPMYNKLIDEIIGTAPFDNPPIKKWAPAHLPPQQYSSCSDLEEVVRPKKDKSENLNNNIDRIDDHNNDAVRSIIEVAQNPQPTQNFGTPRQSSTATLTSTTTSTTTITTPMETTEANKSDNGVYVFDGTLDTYLKSSAGSNPVPPNPVYINTGGLIVMPPETSSKQFYIVNNQPLINMNVSTVKGMITDSDILAMPTIIVNDDQNFAVTTATTTTKSTSKRGKNQKIAPKAAIMEVTEATPKEKKKSKTTKGELINSIPTMSSEPSTVVVTASHTTPSVMTVPTTKAPTPRNASHVRNLDFSTPSTTKAPPTKKKAWDEDLRSLVCPPTNKHPSPKRKRPLIQKPKTKKAKTKNKSEEKEEEENKTEVEEEEKVEEKEKIALMTPTKDMIPKTPGVGDITTNSLQCTPFNDVLEEQLIGVDLISLPTPKIPITPGFAITPGLSLTPAEIPPYNNRSTDYSTSSSYYQPSDTEQNKSVEQLIEECRRLENKSPPPPPPFPPDKQLKIISEVVIKESCLLPIPSKIGKNEHLKKFNHNVIGKKNLSLLKRSSSSSSSSDSDSSEAEIVGEQTNKTMICKKNNESAINDIIGAVEVKKTLDEEARKKNLLTHLEEVRKRTIDKIKNPPDVPKKTRKPPAKPKTPKRTTEPKKKRNTKKKEPPPEENNTDEEAQKLVTGLAQRGIHLIHKKTPQKSKGKKQEPIVVAPPKEETKAITSEENEDSIVFNRRVCEDYDLVIHEKGGKKKNLKTYDVGVLKKGFEARVFALHLNEEVTRTMRATPFEMLLDLPAKTITSPKKNKKTNEEIEDELMDYVFIGSARESPEIKPTTKGGKKRKSRLSEDGKQVEKKSKTYENDIKLLKKIDVDMFLDKVHGE